MASMTLQERRRYEDAMARAGLTTMRDFRQAQQRLHGMFPWTPSYLLDEAERLVILELGPIDGEDNG